MKDEVAKKESKSDIIQKDIRVKSRLNSIPKKIEKQELLVTESE